MRRTTKALFLALAGLTALAAPAAAQVGVLDQPYRNDPFQPLLEGRWSFTHYLNVGAENNTLGVGDVVAIGHLATDFRPSDIFLIAGLVPEGQGVRIGSQVRSSLALTFPVGQYLTLGLLGGGRVISDARVPDEVAALIRDGIVGDEITVNLTELGGEAFGYAEGGLSAVVDYPLMPTPMGDVQLMAGAGARYVHSLSHMRVGFSGDEGEATSTFTLTRTGVDTELHIATPLAESVLAEGGGGVAVDLMAGVAVGHVGQVRLAVTDLGSATVNVGERSISTISIDNASFVELGTAADSVAVTDTLAPAVRSVALPTTLRLDATYRPLDRIGLGARIAAPMGDVPALEPLMQAAVELRPFRVLPLRAGVSGGGTYGTGFFGGIGLDTRTLRFDLELASAGGPALAEVRGLTVRSALALRF